ncbi:TonB-dependent receptor [Opitutus sp. ER46]|uniref:TonB-dependent receptor n=1 Tax=Opitutus sp. ER46 TaxID=2161864 RepID=UPI000D30F473|nr:TonB-dependent receptor [Opitutus sp. ER46]PTX91380.1 hypothetical protein DB354_15915 [Opitutus sp. ER46]
MKFTRYLALSASLLVATPLLCAADETTSAAPATPAVITTGVITGAVLNPISKEYVRNAEVQVEGAGLSAITEADGTYRLMGVPAGTVTLVVTYTGYTPARATVNVTAESIVTQNFDLGEPLGGRSAKSETIVLGEFVVSGEREGNSKAIMSQRRAMDITNSIASDVFGDVAEGNVGEFLKNLAGVDLETVEGDVRTVRLRGLAADYTGVTVDGVTLASADANGASTGGSRAFTFEQVSLNSMDSIEVFKTTSADMDANAPAGTINLKSKRAFDRQGRRITWQTQVNMNSTDMTLSRTDGPDNGKHRKVRPGGILEYSDVFLNKRLGIVLNISESNTYNVSARSTMAYNYAATATDPRPVVPYSMAQTIGPKFKENFSTTLTVDYKLSPTLNFGVTMMYNYTDQWFNLRTATLYTATSSAATRTTANVVKGDDSLYGFTTTTTGSRLNMAANGISKPGEVWTYIPRFQYKIGKLTIEGRFAYSDARSWYDPLGREGAIFGTGSMAVSGMFAATRSSYSKTDWKFRQLSGNGWDTGASYSTPTLSINDGRSSRSKVGSGEITGSFSVGSKPVIAIKTGIKAKRETRDFKYERAAYSYTYEGPGSGVGAWKDYRLPYAMDFSLLESAVISTSGAEAYVPDIQKIGALFLEHPEYFSRAKTDTGANYYSAFVENRRHYEEAIDSAYAMATTTLWRKLTLRAGLRWEGTEGDSREFDARTPDEVKAAGYKLDSSGIATTVDGVKYQYMSKPQTHRKREYDNFFPSASAKYKFLPNLDLQLAYSKTIRRPSYADMAGVLVIDEDSTLVTAPNPYLKPETSDNLSARLAYYFEPVGQFAVNLYQNRVKNLLVNADDVTAEEYGYTGPLDLSGYRFSSTVNRGGTTKLNGMELEYSQSLSFLPGPLSGLNVRGTYTRSESSITNPNMAPHAASGGLNYTFRRVNLYVNTVWTDDTPTSSTGLRYRKHRASVDAGGSVRLTQKTKLFFSARNIFNEPFITLEEYPNCPAVAVNYAKFGTFWTFGVKGTF